MGGNPFARLLTQHLEAKGITLREAARRSGIDASNLSKMERGVIYPPRKRETLIRLSQSLGLDEAETRCFLDAADQANGMLPADMDTARQNDAIPLLLRAIDNRQLSLEETQRLAKLIEDGNAFQGRLKD